MPERRTQITTDAAKRLGADAYVFCPGEDWRGVCRMGDVLRHSYYKIDDSIIWNTVKEELPQTCQAAMKALRTLSPEGASGE